MKSHITVHIHSSLSLCSSSLIEHSLLSWSSLSVLKKSSNLRLWLPSVQLRPSFNRVAFNAAFCAGSLLGLGL